MEKPSGDTVRWYHAQQRIAYNGSTMMFIISASAHHHTFNRGISLRAETLINGRAGCASGDLSPHMVLGRRISMIVSDSELETLAALTYALAPNKPCSQCRVVSCDYQLIGLWCTMETHSYYEGSCDDQENDCGGQGFARPFCAML